MTTKPKILHLTLKKKWFDMILEGKKVYEFREIKPYWNSRLLENPEDDFGDWIYKYWDFIKFRNGYGKDKPTFLIEFKFAYRAMASSHCKHLGATPGKWYHTLKMGRIVDTSNVFQKCEPCGGSGYESYYNHDTAYPACGNCGGTGKVPFKPGWKAIKDPDQWLRDHGFRTVIE